MKEIISLTLYAEVHDKQLNKITCRDLDNDQVYELSGLNVLARVNSADVFGKIEQVNKTYMAEKLLDAGDKVFTVVFVKQDGNIRTLRGRLVQAEPLMGRAMVEDLDLNAAVSNIRQVDLRTLKELTISNVKYVVK